MRDMVAVLGDTPLLVNFGTRGVSNADRLVCAWVKHSDAPTKAEILAVNTDLPVGATAGPASAAHSHTYSLPQGLVSPIRRVSIKFSDPDFTTPTVASLPVSAGATSFTDILQIGEAVVYQLTFQNPLPGGVQEPPPPPPSFTFLGRLSVPRRVTITPPGLNGRMSIPRRASLLTITGDTPGDTVIPGSGGLTLDTLPTDFLIAGVPFKDVLIDLPAQPPPSGE
jgi:hypothetical protein